MTFKKVSSLLLTIQVIAPTHVNEHSLVWYTCQSEESSDSIENERYCPFIFNQDQKLAVVVSDLTDIRVNRK